MSTDQYRAKLRTVLSQANGVPLSNDDEIESFVASLPRHTRDIVGGNTTCVEVSDGETLLVIDAGSGMRALGNSLMAGPFGHGKGEAHILFSHHHHDHTCGFPFFVPAYIPGNILHFYGCHENIETRMVGLQAREYFPVPFHVMASKKLFHQCKSGAPMQIGRFTITPAKLYHPGDSYGYRIEWGQRSFVFASDSEYKNPSEEAIEAYVEFFRDADLLYFDGQYSLQEAFVKENWGHSSALVGVDFAVRAKVRKLLISHHDPMYSDETIVELGQQAAEYLSFAYPDASLDIESAFEGDAFDLSDG